MARLSDPKLRKDLPVWTGSDAIRCGQCDSEIIVGGVWCDHLGATAICPKCALLGAKPLAQTMADALLDAGEAVSVDGAVARFCDEVRRAYQLGKQRENEEAQQ